MKNKPVYSLSNEVIFSAIHSLRWELRQQWRHRNIYTGAERQPFRDRIKRLIRAQRAMEGYLTGKAITAGRRSVTRGYTKTMRRFMRKLRAERRRKGQLC